LSLSIRAVADHCQAYLVLNLPPTQGLPSGICGRLFLSFYKQGKEVHVQTKERMRTEGLFVRRKEELAIIF